MLTTIKTPRVRRIRVWGNRLGVDGTVNGVMFSVWYDGRMQRCQKDDSLCGICGVKYAEKEEIPSVSETPRLALLCAYERWTERPEEWKECE